MKNTTEKIILTLCLTYLVSCQNKTDDTPLTMGIVLEKSYSTSFIDVNKNFKYDTEDISLYVSRNDAEEMNLHNTLKKGDLVIIESEKFSHTPYKNLKAINGTQISTKFKNKENKILLDNILQHKK